MAKVGIAVGMIGSSAKAALWLGLGALTLGAAVATGQAFAQEPAEAPAAEQAAVLSADELAKLVGPIALYPDDLVGIVLPASTYPLQVVQAARFLDERAKNSSLKPNDDWDDSVVALLNYPEVVKLMNDDLDWTWRLGDAVINQRADVLDAVQGFRDRAYAAGNLRTDNRQIVENDDAGAIAIKPADPEVIYVPYYEPERVVVYQPAPVYHYYPYGYPVYYYPYPAGYAFNTGFFWGVTSAFVIGWHSHYLQVCPHDYWGHPYYGRSYHDSFYVRRNLNTNVSVSRGGYVWQPHYRAGGQPFTRSNGQRVTGTRGGGPAAARTQGSYRTGGTGGMTRSAGEQRAQPVDPRAAASRDGATAGTNPRTAAPVVRAPGQYRSGVTNGGVNGGLQNGAARSGQQRSGGTTAGDANHAGGTSAGSAPNGGQTNRPAPDNGSNPTPDARAPGSYRRAQLGTQPQVRDAAPATPRAGAPAATRAPGQYQYRSGGVSQGARTPQTQARTDAGGANVAAPTLRVAPPPQQAERSAGAPRSSGSSFGGVGGAYRTERAAPPAQRAAPPADRAAAPAERAAAPPARSDDGGSSRGDFSRGDGGGGARSAPAYRSGGEGRSSGGGEGRSSGGHNGRGR